MMLTVHSTADIINSEEKLFDGKATGNKAKQTITLQKDAPVYFSKFKRYARGKSTIHAHVPLCIDVEARRPCTHSRMQTNIKISFICSCGG